MICYNTLSGSDSKAINSKKINWKCRYMMQMNQKLLDKGGFDEVCDDILEVFFVCFELK